MPTYRNPREAARALKPWFDEEEVKYASESRPDDPLGLVPNADHHETFQYDARGRYKLGSNPERELLNRAAAIYGETSSLYPQRINPGGSLYDPANLDPQSVADIAEARRNIGLISERNNRVNYDFPDDFNNPIEKAAWERSLQAAAAGANMQGELDPRYTNFIFTPNKMGKSAITQGAKIVNETSKFYNGGGGDVLAGPNTRVQFWGPRK